MLQFLDHERMKGRGCGAWLLIDALHRGLTHAHSVAAMAVVVDAKDQAAVRFYRHFDFRPRATCADEDVPADGDSS